MTDLKITGRYFRKYPVENPSGYATKEFSLSLANTVFLLVDVYGLGLDIHPEEVENPPEPAKRSLLITTETKKEIVNFRLKPALEAAREVGLPIVYVSNSAPRIALANSTYWEHKWDTLHLDKDVFYAEEKVDPLEYHTDPSDVLKYSEVIAPQAGDYYIRKHVHSGFFDTRLDTLLRNLGCKNLVCVGFALDVCLGTTMIDALWRNYRVFLLRDCTFASEIPNVDQHGEWTKRWILYTECAIGYTLTSPDWIAACQAAV